MLTEKIAALDLVLRLKHSEIYASLRPCVEVDPSLTTPLLDWYEWKNGQSQETENMFFDYYRFIPFEEARKLCVFQTEYSFPLLTDYAGEGYYFSTINRKMFYNAATFYDKKNLEFSSFESFLDFLIELANSPSFSIGEFIETEEAILSKYT